MSEKFDALTAEQIEFIQSQHLFFVGTAAPQGLVNVSPKGMDSLRVLDNNRVAWLNLTGSGNETAAHLLALNRMTLMFCSFDRQPLILRLYGEAKTIHPRDELWSNLIELFPDFTGARQIYDMSVELVQTSCGYAVPFYEMKGERPTLTKWADNKGREGVEDYWSLKNTRSLDGMPTGVVSDVPD